MDPDANLREQRECVKEINRLVNGMFPDSQTIVPAMRLAELVEALDEWICRGGSTPRVWDKN